MKRHSFLGDLAGTGLRDEGGQYTWPPSSKEPQRFISVTSVISILNKPGLYQWHAAMERDYIKSRLLAVKMGEVKGKEVIDEFCTDQKWTSKAAAFRDQRAQLGSRVHHEITRYVLAREEGMGFDPEGVEDECRPFIQSFHLWFEKEAPSYLFVEGPVFNTVQGYAGTSDALVAFRDGNFVIDYKISPQTNKDHALQLAAYRKADFIGIKNTGQEVLLPKTDGGGILLVHPDGCKLHWQTCSDREYEVFLQAMSIHKWRNQEYSQPKEAY